MKDSQRADAASFDPAKEVYWTPLMAVVWIVYRDMNEVRKVWPEFVKDRCDFHFNTNQQYVVAPSEAVRELWRHLQSGIFIASGKCQGARRVIEKPEWCDLPLIDLENPLRFVGGTHRDRTYLLGQPQTVFFGVRLSAEDVLRVFPSKDSAASKKVELREAATSTERSIRKPTKAQAAADVPKRRYSEGRPSTYADQLLTELKPEVGVISPRTLTRALALAWPSVPRPRAKK
jgi:hypothetical protein